ncbi:PKD repeat-containing protein [Methanophagales archaeon]|nr:PKD repeat-containing protein [Methanophagales archaeon]
MAGVNSVGDFVVFTFTDKAPLPQPAGSSGLSILQVDAGVTLKGDSKFHNMFVHFSGTEDVPEEVVPTISVTETSDTAVEVKFASSPDVTIFDLVKDPKAWTKVGWAAITWELGALVTCCYIDSSAPVLTLLQVPEESGWFIKKPVSVQVVDSCPFGVTITKPDGSTSSILAGDIFFMRAETEFTLDKEGIYTIDGRDLAGNHIPPEEVKIDTIPPNAVASPSSQTVDVGESASFDGSGSSDATSGIDRYEWDFDDGSSGSGKTASHAYGSVGTYTVTLKVWDNAGNDGTGTAQAQVGVEVIPEFSTIAIPVVAIIGLLFLISRRKQKE